MLRFLVVLLVSFNVAFAADLKDNLSVPSASQGADRYITLSGLEKSTVDRSGCCSHHGGVCGCSGARQQCCDGALSPSCTCNHDDNDKTIN
jgi:hypothetical protein